MTRKKVKTVLLLHLSVCDSFFEYNISKHLVVLSRVLIAHWYVLQRHVTSWYVNIGSANAWHGLVPEHLRENDDVIKWKHFLRYWPFVRGINRSPVNSPHKGQWRRALIFSLICAWISGWVNNGEAGDLRRHRTHYDVIVMNNDAHVRGPYMRKTVSSTCDKPISGDVWRIPSFRIGVICCMLRMVSNISESSVLPTQWLFRPCWWKTLPLSLSFDLLFKILLFQTALFVLFSIAIFSLYFLLVRLLLQYVALFQSKELVKGWCHWKPI